MKPTRFDGANSVLKLPGGTDENDLPCRVENGWTHSRWETTEAERARIIESGMLVVWLWWPNLLGVSVKVGEHGRRHTEVDTPTVQQVDEDGANLISLVVSLDETEREAIERGELVHLAVDMHPTCPVAVTTYEPRG